MNLTESTQFHIKEVTIETSGGSLPIVDMVEEIHFFDNLFLPVLSGQVLVTDTRKLHERIILEKDVIKFHITKLVDDTFNAFKKAFRIYHISERRNINNTSEGYIIHFVADELMFSMQNKVADGFEGKYSKLVEKIMTQYLKVPESKRGIIEESSGIRKVTVPNLPPLEALEWCAKRALSSKNVPDFLFFSNRAGYNFRSLSKLLTGKPVLDINFSPKNLDDGDSFFELSKARGFEVLSQFDSISRITSGVDAGTFIGFDPITRTFGSKPIEGDKTYDAMEHGNRNAYGKTVVNRDGTSNKTTFDSKQTLSTFSAEQKKSAYIKKKDPTIISKNESQEMFLHQRQAILTRLMEKRLRIVMPGNFQLSSGLIVNIDSSGFGVREKGEDSNSDSSLSGKYIITGTRHIIGLRRHTTIIEVASDSTVDKRKVVSAPTQNETLKNYDTKIVAI